MPDELQGVQGQPAPEVAPTNVMVAPTPEQAPATAQEVTQTKYSGKSLDELAREMEEKDRYISEVNERAARAEHEAMLTRNLVEQFARTQGKPQEQVPEVPPVSDDEFLTNPAKATSKIIESYFERDKREREREKATQYVATARTAYEEGKTEAIKSNPGLYRGIEADLAREVLNTVQASFQQGAPIDASALRNPRYWEAAAVAMRIMNGEDVSKYYMKAPQPMSPTHQETPSPGAVPRVVPTLSEADRAGARFFGLTDEQWLATKAKQAEGK